MTTTDPAAVVIRYIEAVRDGDSDAIRGQLRRGRHLGVSRRPAAVRDLARPRRDRQRLPRRHGHRVSSPAPGDAGSHHVLTEGDQVVAEWTSRATARGGAAYDNRNIGIFTVRDGKIAAVREYTDTQHAAHVLFGQS